MVVVWTTRTACTWWSTNAPTWRIRAVVASLFPPCIRVGGAWTPAPPMTNAKEANSEQIETGSTTRVSNGLSGGMTGFGRDRDVYSIDYSLYWL